MTTPTKNGPTSVKDIDIDVLEDTLSFYIRSINIAVSRDLDEKLEGLDVAQGTGKITTLFLVDGNPGIRPSTIAQVIFKDRSAMGRLVDQMEGHGLLRRQIAPEDSRAQALYITDKGAQLAEHVRRLVTLQSREFFSEMTDEEHDLVLDVLRRAYRRILERS